MPIKGIKLNQEMNIRSKGAWPRSRDLLSNVGPPHISETSEDTNIKFCMLTEY